MLHKHMRSLLQIPDDFEVQESVLLRRANEVLVPLAPGIYLVSDLRGVLYVGRTISLRRRYREHLEAAKNDLLRRAKNQPFGTLTFHWRVIDDSALRASIERQLVCWLQPPCNRVIPGLN